MKVFWSDPEKALVAKEAIDIQRSKPELSGLPLLRAAMRTLPMSRRRKITAMSQVKWFEDWVASENRRRSIQSEEDHVGLKPLQMHDSWRREQMESMARTERLLEKLNRNQVKMIAILKNLSYPSTQAVSVPAKMRFKT